MKAFPPKTRAFTLVEMLLVLLITTLLVGTVFGIISSVTLLTNSLRNEQLKDSQHEGLARIMKRTFRNLPAEGFLQLKTQQTGRHYLTRLLLINNSPLFTSSHSDITELRTEEDADGYLRLVLYLYPQEKAQELEIGSPTASGTRIVLLEGLSSLSWRAYGGQMRQWDTLCNETVKLTTVINSKDLQISTRNRRRSSIPSRTDGQQEMRLIDRPEIMELTLVRGIDEPMKWLFWIPPLDSRK